MEAQDIHSTGIGDTEVWMLCGSQQRQCGPGGGSSSHSLVRLVPGVFLENVLRNVTDSMFLCPFKESIKQLISHYKFHLNQLG